MKKSLLIFALAIASNSFAQDTTKAMLRGKTITIISHGQKPTESFELNKILLKCDSLQMSKSCKIAQLWETEELSNEYNSLIFKVLHQKLIKEVHKLATETYALCRNNYGNYKECLKKNGVK